MPTQCTRHASPPYPMRDKGERASKERGNGQVKGNKHMSVKIAFVLHSLVAGLLPKSIDQKKLVEACEAYRNGMEIVEGSAKTERKLRIAGSKSAGTKAEERQSIRVTMTGKDNVVSRFIAYNDEVRVTSERAAKFEGELSLKVLPSEFEAWITTKFDTKAPKAPAKSKSDEGNGAPARGVTPAVPA